MENYNVIIIGGGPAGVSAALYLARANFKVAIVENGPGALARAHKIDNFYGIAASGSKLYAEGLAQAKALGVAIITDEVLAVEYFDSFVLTLKQHTEPLPAPVLILATGTKNITLNLPGLVELEGKGISYCAVCDGFFFRKKNLAVLGHVPYALHEAEYLRHLAQSVTVLTNGHFIALGTADSTDMARKLGAQLEGRFIKVDEDGATNIPGLFAAGDCIGGLKQVAKAVHDGARAGLAAIKFLRRQ